MAGQVEKLAQFVAQTQWDDIPRDVREHAKLVVLDTLGVVLAGSEQPELRELRERVAATVGTGATIFARDWPAADPRTAALINGIAGRSLELGEGYRNFPMQGAVQILPGVLATGEWLGGTGREMLIALMVGYDVAVRFGAGMTGRPLSHPNGQVALLGAVAAGARMRGFDAAATSRAMRIAATLMLTPSYTNAVAGATALNVAGGMSGYAAVFAPDLALAGFTAKDDAIEESLGNLVGDGYRPDNLLDELGTRWEITRNWFRLRACCNPIYAALDALEEALAVLEPRPEDVERIDVAAYRLASVMRNADPPNYFAAKYSLPHAAAALIVKGHTGYGAFTEAVVHDPAVAALRHRVHVTEDAAMTAAFPRLKAARVTLTLKDGRQSTHACDSPRGDFLKPYNESELRQKFRELAGLVLTPAGAADLEACVARCDEWTNVNELVQRLRAATR